MAVKVLHKPTGQAYVLIGTGFGTYKSSTPSFLGCDLFPKIDQGDIAVAAVCDRRGQIVWLPTDELQVLEVDGIRIGGYFLDGLNDAAEPNSIEAEPEQAEDDTCPACGFQVSPRDIACPSCGLTLVDSDEPA